MININDINKISDYLSSIFFYGFSRRYSNISIEERLLSSDIIKDLESGDTDFLYNQNIENIIQQIYEVNEEIDTLSTNAVSLWLGEAYTKLFFTFSKSFSYIFLYFPLETAINAFELYHEMGFSQVFDYFLDLTKSKTILSTLLKKRDISARELSILTSIKYNTIIGYTRNDENIYNAKYENIYLISYVLKVNPNIFLRRINLFTIGFFGSSDNKDYYFHYSLFVASFFDRTIKDSSNLNYVEIKDDHEINQVINSYQLDKKTLLIYTSKNINEKEVEIKNDCLEKVIIINKSIYLSFTKDKTYRREISTILYEAATNIAKNMANIDIVF